MPIWRRKEDRDRANAEGPEDWEREDPFDDPFFDMQSDLFHDFDDQFRRMRTYMDAMMEKAASGEARNPDQGGPFVYGWSMRVGPDGVPHVQTFGNVRPKAMRGGRELTAGNEGAGDDDGECSACSPEAMVMPGVREPLTDVCEAENEITITAEMPGIEKDNIELETGEDFLVIKVEKGSRRFYKELPLNLKVAPNSARAKYNNGVLEITVGKLPVEKRSTNVKVE